MTDDLTDLLARHQTRPATSGRGMGDSPETCMCGRWDGWAASRSHADHLASVLRRAGYRKVARP